MITKPPSSNFFRTGRLRPSLRAFSLVEVTLALGIVTFGLVGVVGVLPVAMTANRQSFDKNRAAAIAGTLFTSFRSQPFQKVGYLDTQFKNDGTSNPSATGLLDLNALNSTGTNPPSPEVKFYATFLDVSTPTGDASDTFGQQRHLCFTSALSGGADYLVTLHFKNQPDGMAISPVTGAANSQPTVPAQANQVEIIVSPVSRPADSYRFVSIVANRTN